MPEIRCRSVELAAIKRLKTNSRFIQPLKTTQTAKCQTKNLLFQRHRSTTVSPSSPSVSIIFRIPFLFTGVFAGESVVD